MPTFEEAREMAKQAEAELMEASQALDQAVRDEREAEHNFFEARANRVRAQDDKARADRRKNEVGRMVAVERAAENLAAAEERAERDLAA